MYTNDQQLAHPPVPPLSREEQADVDRLAAGVANALPGALLMLRIAEHLKLTPPEIMELMQVKGGQS
jgi:hypothetical protein